MAKLEDRCKSIVNQGLYFKKRNYRENQIMIQEWLKVPPFGTFAIELSLSAPLSRAQAFY
jgi:hypothetical protein